MKVSGLMTRLLTAVAAAAAFGAPAEARPGDEVYCNRSRGFSEFGYPGAESITVSSSGPEPVSVLMAAGESGAGDFTLTFRADNRHDSPMGRYRVTDSEGRIRKVGRQPWGVAVKSGGHTHLLSFATKETETFTGSEERPEVTFVSPCRPEMEAMTAVSSASLSSGWNSFTIVRRGGRVSISAGGRESRPLAEFEDTGCLADSIGFFAMPGAEVEIRDIVWRDDRDPFAELATVWTDTSLLEEYLSHSADPLEGYWKVLDSSLDYDLLRQGGDYTLAIVRDTSGYALIYLSGADVARGRWSPGFRKGTLLPSGFEGIYDLTWYDAEGRPLSHNIKAQKDAPQTLSLHFPFHNSTLRLQRIPHPDMEL